MLFAYYSYVFFFKQKTAYEMRISDWSSDVCSSDLQVVYPAAHIVVLLSLSGTALGLVVGAVLGLLSGYVGGWIDNLLQRFLEALISIPFQIGRASCRERVCQYV